MTDPAQSGLGPAFRRRPPETTSEPRLKESFDDLTPAESSVTS
jgi:hypothetical protein